MAQWKETLEPYVKVIESVKTAVLNPSAGGNLILGAVLISDCGPAEPTLITSQSDFLKVFAAEELTKEYVKTLDSLYVSDPGSSLASTMWLNAYRLAGSANMLICRASRANNVIYSQPLKEDGFDYILKDSEVLKSVPSFKLVIDEVGSKRNGWAIAVNGVGIIGNLVDDNGARYDYKADNLVELVEKLNETDKFYASSYEFYLDEKCTIKCDDSRANEAIAVLFKEVYLAPKFLDTTELTTDNELWEEGVEATSPSDTSTTPAPTTSTGPNYSGGLAYIFAATPEWSWNNTEGVGVNQTMIALNSSSYSGFTPFTYYASNLYNTRTDLSVRIRRFNHNAVTAKKTNSSLESPWDVDEKVLAYSDPNYDFYEFCIVDPSISEEAVIFNVGNLPGRGDVKAEEMLSSLSMIYMNLPDNLIDLGLNYYNYKEDDGSWTKVKDYTSPNITTIAGKPYIIDGDDSIPVIAAVAALPSHENSKKGDKYAVGSGTYALYEYVVNVDAPYIELNVNLKINDESALLQVSDSDLKAAWDKIEDDERYVVEGFADLGCTYSAIQNYVANIAVNSNYFYAFSLANTTNYMTIANSASKMATKSHKLYAAAPWDYDDGTVGFQFAVSPSTIYWETVLRNRLNNNEFAGVFGQNAGRVSVMNLAKEFKKSERQLLLTKKINTIGYDSYLGIHHFNDNYTFTDESFVMSEECNSRLQIRISKAMPLLLNQFKGRQNTSRTWMEIRDVINYWFNNTIMRYNYTIAEYRVICDDTNNTAESIRANKVFVKVQVRFNSSIKYITVYNDAYPIGVDFEE